MNMRLRAGCELHVEVPAPAPVVAMLRPRSDQAQWIASERYDFEPLVGAVEYTDAFGNLCQRFTVPLGRLRVRTEVEAEVLETIATRPFAAPTPVAQLPDHVLQFLLPSRYCPSDMMETQAREIASAVREGYDQAEAIRAWIHQNIEYRYGASNASTTALDTVRDKAGVCRDFAHVGAALCRALRMPARVVAGYLYQLDPMDLHAWFEVFIDGQWLTFDATQSAPRGGRIAIAVGRDAADVALITEFAELKIAQMNVWVERLG